MTVIDLVFFTGSVYGLAWLITRARLTAPVRKALERVPYLGTLLRCIVCTGTWVAMGVLLVARWSKFFSPQFRSAGPVDIVFLLGWSMAAIWTLARLNQDAD